MPDINNFIASHFFVGLKRTGTNQYSAKCPCHNDKHNSLVIGYLDTKDFQGDYNKIGINCLAGCSLEDLMARIGFDQDDISGTKDKTLEDFLVSRFGVDKSITYNAKVTDIYDYQDIDGNYLYSKVRFEETPDKSKQIRYARINRTTNEIVTNKGDTPKGIFGLQSVRSGREKGQPIYIVEGEKDVRTLHKERLFACTFGGASDYTDAFLPLFKGANIVILEDNDQAGRASSDRLENELRKVAFSVTRCTPSKLNKGDVTDYLKKENGTKEGLLEMISDSDTNYGYYVIPGKSPRINADLLAKTVSDQEHYFIARNSFDDKDDLYVYHQGVYEHVNKSGFISEVIRPYIPLGFGSVSVMDNAYKLILSQGTHVTTLRELNTDYRYINLLNGLLDVNTGELRPHNPAIYTTTQLNVVYDKDARKMPNFQKYIDDLARDNEGNVDESKKAIWQEYIGLLWSNIPGYTIKKALFLTSSRGNTGKSTLFRLFSFVMGQEQMTKLSLQQMDNGNYITGSRFNLGSIANKRLIFCSDNPADPVKDNSTFKQLTGGDEVTIESKGRQGFGYTFRGLIMIACNEVPYFEGDMGKHVLERMIITECKHHIPEDQRDTDLDEKLKKEIPAIFNFAFEGLQRLIANNYHFTECQDAEETKEVYRSNSDSLYSFINQSYLVTGDYNDLVRKTDLEDKYIAWANQLVEEQLLTQPLAKRNIQQRMASYGIIWSHTKKGRFYRGLVEKAPEDSNPFLAKEN